MTPQNLRIRTMFAMAMAALLSLSACAQDPAVAKQRYVDKAQSYFAKGEYNEAIIQLKNALQIDPKFPPAVHLLGRTYARKAWHFDALRELRRAAELQPDNLETRTDLARVYAAIEAWNRVLQEADAVAGHGMCAASQEAWDPDTRIVYPGERERYSSVHPENDRLREGARHGHRAVLDPHAIPRHARLR